MTQDSFWKNNPHLMMSRANELGRLVEHLDAEKRDGVWLEGTTIAVPVLLSLAVEIPRARKMPVRPRQDNLGHAGRAEYAWRCELAIE